MCCCVGTLLTNYIAGVAFRLLTWNDLQSGNLPTIIKLTYPYYIPRDAMQEKVIAFPQTFPALAVSYCCELSPPFLHTPVPV
jgi:hypothetical protein